MPPDFVFDPPPTMTVAVTGDSRLFPVRRIFCVGRNYAAHAAEMGNEVDREAPFYFTKSAQAICPSGATIPYPPGTAECHYEMELVVALGRGGAGVTRARAMTLVFGHACGIDLTRRDLQAAAKAARRPWDLGKDFDNAAIVAPIARAGTRAGEVGDIGDRRIHLDLDGRRVQQARLAEMIWSVPEIIAHLSDYYTLAPGDLIFTGTPAGVGPVGPGARLCGGIDGLAPVSVSIGPARQDFSSGA